MNKLKPKSVTSVTTVVETATTRKPHIFWTSGLFASGDGGSRTHDLLNAIQALSQLSYAPEIFSANYNTMK